MGIGAAMTGLRPIIEGMNMGFLLLAYNQISNNAGMLHYTSGGQYKVCSRFRNFVLYNSFFGAKTIIWKRNFFFRDQHAASTLMSNDLAADGPGKGRICLNRVMNRIESVVVSLSVSTTTNQYMDAMFAESSVSIRCVFIYKRHFACSFDFKTVLVIQEMHEYSVLSIRWSL